MFAAPDCVPTSLVSPRVDRAFTLLEILISMALIVLLLAVAMPSMTGQTARRRLQDSYDRFDALVIAAQQHTMAEGRPYALVWDKEGAVRLFPADLSAEDRRKSGPVASLSTSAASSPERGGKYTLERNASLTAAPVPVWTFWPTGNCEPVVVRYAGPAGTWAAAFNPLSGRGTLNTFLAQ